MNEFKKNLEFIDYYKNRIDNWIWKCKEINEEEFCKKSRDRNKERIEFNANELDYWLECKYGLVEK